MLRIISILSILLLLGSCTPKYLSSNITKEISRICLNLDGNGRLSVQGHKYVFSAETVLDEEENKWIMGMGFPLHGQEVIELDLTLPDAGFSEKIQEKVLSEKAGINPADLDLFMKRWASFLNEIIAIKRTQRAPSNIFKWSTDPKIMTAISKISEEKEIEAKFYNLSDNYFSRMDFILKPKDTKKQIKIELIVRKCLDS